MKPRFSPFSVLNTFYSTGCRVLFGCLTLIVLSFVGGSFFLWHQYDAVFANLARGEWPIEQGGREIILKKIGTGGSSGTEYRFLVERKDSSSMAELHISGQDFSPVRLWSEGEALHLASLPKNQHYAANEGNPDEIRAAVREAAELLPQPDVVERIGASLLLRPFITGIKWGTGGLLWRINTSKGVLWVGNDSLPHDADLKIGEWRLRISGEGEFSLLPTIAPMLVPAEDLTSCIAEAIRLVTTLAAPAKPKADSVRQSGAGWLAVRNGHIQMFLEGSPYEIGHQHGSLDPEGVSRVCHRLVYGVGLLYSFKNGEWFPTAARKLVERQRPFIASAYFDEMKGLAHGAGLPLDLIQMANIFPEFFHCSGAALMGDATEGGELLHARVLDYMVGIGLQDHAAVMAISRPGVNRFVTVGYLGFIGSVTGMNEKQVSIGEMGGNGQGDWDGVPMSLLIRQSLETCNTLQEVETLMRNSPRTCKYYYLISDGKGPTALGVAATPSKFETFGPGVWNERLTQPLEDTVLISGPGRYEELVKRVKEGYGKISRNDLIEIIKRPVAMKSNLHSVIFQPQSLRLSVANASRNGPACNQPYCTYSWKDLFSAAPSH